jgi:hypothetical protein
MDDAPVDEPGFLASTATTLRLMFAWACLAIGVLDLSMGIDLDDPSYLVFHVVLLITGVVLMSWQRLPGPLPRTGLAATGLVVAAGVVVSAVTEFPFPIGGADAVFWVCIGVLMLSVVRLVRPVRPVAEVAPAPGGPQHAEPRVTEAPVARDENVRGLP